MPRHNSPFAHLYHTFHDTTQRTRNFLDPNMLRRYVNDQYDYLLFDERSHINEFLALMITLTNYERSAHSRLHHLGDHISSVRDPTLATQRRDTASSTRRALRSADTSTQGQLERLDLFIEI